MTRVRRVVVVGFDGLDPRIFERLLAAGLLPAFARVREAGGYGRVATTLPAQTPVAWSTFATGTNPGGHGIYDFIRRDPRSYLADFSLNRFEQKNMFTPPKAMNLRRGEPGLGAALECGGAVHGPAVSLHLSPRWIAARHHARRHPVGGTEMGRGYRLDKSTTRFNSLVWRKMYLSLFMFTGQYTIEQVADATVIHLPYRFRNELDMRISLSILAFEDEMGFLAALDELILVMQKGEIAGALWSSDFDNSHPYVEHTWDGLWQWTNAGQLMPYVSLYTYILNPKNPHLKPLDAAYREMEAEMRPNLCFVCHSPDNRANVDQLEFFNLPNQALYSRHNIVAQLSQNKMPPDNDAGITPGIADDSAREKPINLAKTFASIGDQALAFEDELKPQYVPPDMGTSD